MSAGCPIWIAFERKRSAVVVPDDSARRSSVDFDRFDVSRLIADVAAEECRSR